MIEDALTQWDDNLVGANAEQVFAEAAMTAMTQYNAEGLQEIYFVYLALADYEKPDPYKEAREFLAPLIQLKNHQNPGAFGKLVQLMEALALKKFFEKGMMLGGGQGK